MWDLRVYAGHDAGGAVWLGTMGHEISNLLGMEMVVPALGHAASFPTRLLFERANYQSGSAFLHHVPFLFWLVEASRPRLVVESGLCEGDAYFAVCQAVDRLGLDSRCCGILASDADDATIQALRTHNGHHYAHLSHLVRNEEPEAARAFPDGSIDLLLLPASDGPDPLAGLAAWKTRLSPRAVVLLNGVGHRLTDAPARIFDDPLGCGRPSMIFEQGDGLAVLLWGAEPDERLARLAALRFGSAAHSEAHRAFARLGSAMHLEAVSRERQHEIEVVRQSLETAQQSGHLAEERVAALTARVDWLEKAYESRNQQIAVLQAKLFDRNNEELAPVLDRLASKAREVEELRVQVEDRFRETAALTRLLESRASEIEALKQQLRAKSDEILAMSQEAAQAPAQPSPDLIAERDRKIAWLRKEVVRLRDKAARSNRRTQSLQRRLDAVLDSTSWRVTAPVRRILDRVRHGR